MTPNRKPKLTHELDRDGARRMVMEIINRHERGEEANIVLDEQTLEKPYGWIFYYESKLYLETQDSRDKLSGNGPILVEPNGAFHRFSVARSIESQLRHFERRLEE